MTSPKNSPTFANRGRLCSDSLTELAGIKKRRRIRSAERATRRNDAAISHETLTITVDVAEERDKFCMNERTLLQGP